MPVCILCKQSLSEMATAILPCGHVFHKTCLQIKALSCNSEKKKISPTLHQDNSQIDPINSYDFILAGTQRNTKRRLSIEEENIDPIVSHRDGATEYLYNSIDCAICKESTKYWRLIFGSFSSLQDLSIYFMDDAESWKEQYERVKYNQEICRKNSSEMEQLIAALRHASVQQNTVWLSTANSYADAQDAFQNACSIKNSISQITNDIILNGVNFEQNKYLLYLLSEVSISGSNGFLTFETLLHAQYVHHKAITWLSELILQPEIKNQIEDFAPAFIQEIDSVSSEALKLIKDPSNSALFACESINSNSNVISINELLDHRFLNFYLTTNSNDKINSFNLYYRLKEEKLNRKLFNSVFYNNMSNIKNIDLIYINKYLQMNYVSKYKNINRYKNNRLKEQNIQIGKDNQKNKLKEINSTSETKKNNHIIKNSIQNLNNEINYSDKNMYFKFREQNQGYLIKTTALNNRNKCSIKRNINNLNYFSFAAGKNKLKLARLAHLEGNVENSKLLTNIELEKDKIKNIDSIVKNSNDNTDINNQDIDSKYQELIKRNNISHNLIGENNHLHNQSLIKERKDPIIDYSMACTAQGLYLLFNTYFKKLIDLQQKSKLKLINSISAKLSITIARLRYLLKLSNRDIGKALKILKSDNSNNEIITILCPVFLNEHAQEALTLLLTSMTKEVEFHGGVATFFQSPTTKLKLELLIYNSKVILDFRNCTLDDIKKYTPKPVSIDKHSSMSEIAIGLSRLQPQKGELLKHYVNTLHKHAGLLRDIQLQYSLQQQIINKSIKIHGLPSQRDILLNAIQITHARLLCSSVLDSSLAFPGFGPYLYSIIYKLITHASLSLAAYRTSFLLTEDDNIDTTLLQRRLCAHHEQLVLLVPPPTVNLFNGPLKEPRPETSESFAKCISAVFYISSAHVPKIHLKYFEQVLKNHLQIILNNNPTAEILQNHAAFAGRIINNIKTRDSFLDSDSDIMCSMFQVFNKTNNQKDASLQKNNKDIPKLFEFISSTLRKLPADCALSTILSRLKKYSDYEKINQLLEILSHNPTAGIPDNKLDSPMWPWIRLVHALKSGLVNYLLSLPDSFPTFLSQYTYAKNYTYNYVFTTNDFMTVFSHWKISSNVIALEPDTEKRLHKDSEINPVFADESFNHSRNNITVYKYQNNNKKIKNKGIKYSYNINKKFRLLKQKKSVNPIINDARKHFLFASNSTEIQQTSWHRTIECNTINGMRTYFIDLSLPEISRGVQPAETDDLTQCAWLRFKSIDMTAAKINELSLSIANKLDECESTYLMYLDNLSKLNSLAISNNKKTNL